MDPVTARLRAMGLDWPAPFDEETEFAPVVRDGSTLWISGQIPERNGDIIYSGKVGGSLSPEEAACAAELCALNVLAQARAYLDGNLDRIGRLVNLRVYVNAAAGFGDYSKVADGASVFVKELLGPRGAHTRSTIGVSGLYADIPVEVDAVFSIRD